MPIVNILVNQQYSPSQKSDLLRDVNRAVLDSLDAAPVNVRIVLQAVNTHDVLVAGEPGQEFVQMLVYMLPGRTDAQKQALVAALNKAASSALGVSDTTSRIIIHDIANSNLSVAGGITAQMAGR